MELAYVGFTQILIYCEAPVESVRQGLPFAGATYREGDTAVNKEEYLIKVTGDETMAQKLIDAGLVDLETTIWSGCEEGLDTLPEGAMVFSESNYGFRKTKDGYWVDQFGRTNTAEDIIRHFAEVMVRLP